MIEPAAELSDQRDYRSSCLPSHTAPVISRDLARRLAPHVSWTPANGDMWIITDGVSREIRIRIGGGTYKVALTAV